MLTHKWGNLEYAADPSGIVQVEGRAYSVLRITTPVELRENWRNAICVLESVRGAHYLIRDNGDGFKPTAWNMGRNISKAQSPHRFVTSTPFDKGTLRRADVLNALNNA